MFIFVPVFLQRGIFGNSIKYGFFQILNRKFHFTCFFAEGDTRTRTHPLRGRPACCPHAVFKPSWYKPFVIENFHYIIFEICMIVFSFERGEFTEKTFCAYSLPCPDKRKKGGPYKRRKKKEG